MHPTTTTRYGDLRPTYLNGTLAPSPGASHTLTRMDRTVGLMREQGVTVDVVRAVDHVLAPGVQIDMTQRGADRDDWPALQEQVMAADILVIGTHIWLGDGSRAGLESDFTNRNLTFLTWNLLHLARMLKDNGGIPAYGNVLTAWNSGARFGLHNPEYR